MTVNNLNRTTDSFDGDAQESTGTRHGQQDAAIHVNGGLDGKTGGQMNGGVVVQSGDRVQMENKKDPESTQGI